MSPNNRTIKTVGVIRKNVGEISNTEGTIGKVTGETIMQIKA